MLIRCHGLPAAAGWEKPGIFCCLEEDDDWCVDPTSRYPCEITFQNFTGGASGKSSLSTIKKKKGISKDAQDNVAEDLESKLPKQAYLH